MPPGPGQDLSWMLHAHCQRANQSSHSVSNSIGVPNLLLLGTISCPCLPRWDTLHLLQPYLYFIFILVVKPELLNGCMWTTKLDKMLAVMHDVIMSPLVTSAETSSGLWFCFCFASDNFAYSGNIFANLSSSQQYHHHNNIINDIRYLRKLSWSSWICFHYKELFTY